VSLLTQSAMSGVAALALLAGGSMPDASLDWECTRTTSPPPWATFTRAGTKNVWRSGVLTNIATDVYPIDEDPVTQANRGPLIEEAATNICLRSETFDNASWTKTRGTITANAVAAPDGATTADKFVEDSQNNAHVVNQNPAIVDATAYTFSLYAKAAERSIIWFQLGGSFTGAPVVWFNLGTGVVGTTGSGITASIQSCGNGWYRCRATATTNGGSGTASWSIGTCVADGGQTCQGDSVSGFYLWGAQLEAGSGATSYIATTSASVTRARDVWSRTLGAEFNANEGTLYFEGTLDVTPVGNSIPVSLGNSGTDRMSIVNSTGSFRATIQVASVVQASLVGPTLVASGQVVKGALRYRTDDFAFAGTGAATATDTSGSLPTVTDLIMYGGVIGTSWNGHVQRVSYYPRGLSNNELQALIA
jgi:hypothetical protein